MKLRKLLPLFCALLLAGAGDALAHGRVRVGVGIGLGVGVPVWGPAYRPYYPYYPRPYYYDPFWTPSTVVVVPPAPQVYIEQGVAAEGGQDAGQYWYYCAGAKNYYPYVKECPGGWQKVLPQPAQ